MSAKVETGDRVEMPRVMAPKMAVTNDFNFDVEIFIDLLDVYYYSKFWQL